MTLKSTSEMLTEEDFDSLKKIIETSPSQQQNTLVVDEQDKLAEASVIYEKITSQIMPPEETFKRAGRKLVTKDNALIQASYTLTVMEQRLILLAIANARRKLETTTSDTEITITVDEYLTFFNDNENYHSIHEKLKDACKRLFERSFTYISRDSKKITKSRWVSQISYKDSQAEISIKFAPALIPLISKLEGNFTSYALNNTINFKSIYSFRLYEMVMQFKSSGFFRISIDDFRERVRLIDKYKTFFEIKTKVLEKSINEINTNTDIRIICEYEKFKNAFKFLNFKIQTKEQFEAEQMKESIKNTEVHTFVVEYLTKFWANIQGVAYRCGIEPSYIKTRIIQKGIGEYHTFAHYANATTRLIAKILASDGNRSMTEEDIVNYIKM